MGGVLQIRVRNEGQPAHFDNLVGPIIHLATSYDPFAMLLNSQWGIASSSAGDRWTGMAFWQRKDSLL